MSDDDGISIPLRFWTPPPGPPRVFKDPDIPLTRTEEDGTVTPIFFVKIDGNIYVHPERWDTFEAALNEAKRKGLL